MDGEDLVELRALQQEISGGATLIAVWSIDHTGF
jgi:hypothetical protein